MVASMESLSSLQLTDGTSIHMGDDSQIWFEGKGSIKLKHGVFKDVLYVPSLVVNLLSVYQMKHTGPTKLVVFGSDSVDILDIHWVETKYHSLWWEIMCHPVYR